MALFRCTGPARDRAPVYALHWADLQRQERGEGYDARVANVRFPRAFAISAYSLSARRATSQPKGPVYLWARREVTDEVVDEETYNAKLPLTKWPSVTMPALTAEGVSCLDIEDRPFEPLYSR